MLLAAVLALAACNSETPASGRSAEAGSQQQAAARLTGSALAQAEPAAAAAPAVQERRVRTITPQPGALTTTRSTTVTVEPAQESLVAAGTSGRVTALLHRAGELVTAGDAVVQIDDSNLQLQARNAALSVQSARVNLQKASAATGEGTAQAQAALNSAELSLELAQRQFTEAQALFDAGGISATELSGVEAQLLQARAGQQQAADALARAGRSQGEDLQLLRLQLQQAETQLQQAETALAEARVVAPFTGEVVATLVNPGEFIGAGSPAFRLASVDEQLARFSVPPEDAQRLVQQGIVYLRYNGLDYAAQVWPSAGVPGQSRLVDLTASIYASQSRIPTGTVAQLPYKVVLAEGLLLPTGALSTSGGSTTVFIAVDGVAEQLEVDVLAEAGGQAAVQGLPADAQVIYPAPADLRLGTRISVLAPAGGAAHGAKDGNDRQ
jgi:multidrug efflux pump subunit AcrA (membrane-fusion protein)